MAFPINFFNIHPLPSNHVGTVCYTRKTPFPGEGNRSPWQVRASRALARRGFPRARARRIAKGGRAGFHPKERPRLHAVFSDRFSSRQYISLCRRVWSVFPPEPGDLLNTLIGSTEKNFIVSKRIPRGRTRTSRSAFRGCGIDSSGGNRRECFPARRWGSSSAGRAPRSQRGGRGFNPLLLHHLSFHRNKHAPGD